MKKLPEKKNIGPYLLLIIATIIPLVSIGMVIYVLLGARNASGQPEPDSPVVNEQMLPGAEGTSGDVNETDQGGQNSPAGNNDPAVGFDVSGEDASEQNVDANGTSELSSGSYNDTSGDISGESNVDGNSADPGAGVLPADPIGAYISSMTLHEKVCQMIIATPASLTGEKKPKSAGVLMQNALIAYPVGGLIFDTGNISGGDQIRKFLSDAQGYSRIPLFLTLDEEGGTVTRLQSTGGTTAIGPMLNYSALGTDTAFSNASVIASDIKSYGFNMDLAPVADVWSNPANTVIGDRAYSTDYVQASELVGSAVLGFHSQGIPCCLKHFPGHGDSSADSHYGAVYIYKPLADIKAEECLPFASGINAGADCVMMGHLIVSELGDEPALFSKTLIQDVLRGELGFNGIVMTDSLQMKAMTDHYGVSDIAVKAVDAGCDILLMPSDVPFTVKAIEDAVASGQIPEVRIDQSVRRIIALKVKYGIIQL